MPPRLFAAFFALAICAPAPARAADAEKIAAFTALPNSNPYRDLLLRVENLPDADRQALNSWVRPDEGAPAPVLSSDQLALTREIAAAVRAAASAPLATSDDWPLVPNPNAPDSFTANLTAISLVGVGSVRELARLATRTAAELPPAEAIETYAAVAQLGRQQRAGVTLIEQLTGVAIEGIAQAAAAERLGTFSAAELRQLSDRWNALHPVPSLEVAVAGERDLFFRPILENIIVPGLKALLADPAAGQSVADPAPDFTRDLRLSGLANLGDGEVRITLENSRTGASFTLRPDLPVEGIELLSLDFEQRLAVIRKGDQEAVIHLQSKAIVARKSAATRLREFFTGLEYLDDSIPGGTRLARTLDEVRAHPDGVDGYARDLLAAYQSGIDAQLALAASPLAPRTEPELSPDPLIALTMPTIGKVARTLNNSATASVMLQAAINHRLGQLHESIDPFAATASDPWAEDKNTPFTYTPTPDGGFTLRSRYEVAPDAPYTYKFAAPDAGFVRIK